VLSLVAAAVIETHAQTLQPPGDNDTALDYKNQVAAAVPQAAKKPAGANLAEVPKQVAAKTTSVAASGGFPERVNDALADFLPLVAFAVNSVSTADDKKSVTVAFNPLPAGTFGAVSASATVAQPQVFEPLMQAIDQTVRDTQVKVIQGGIDDFGDVTWSATYAYQPRVSSWEKARTLWGRDYSLYATLLQAAVSQIDSQFGDLAKGTEFNSKLNGAFPNKNVPVDTLTFGQIRRAISDGRLQGFDLDGYIECLRAQGEILGKLDAATRALHFEALPALIDNQPQLTLSATYHDPNKFVGQRTYGVRITIETGNRNFNSVLRAYRQALEKGNVTVINQPTPVDVNSLENAIEEVAAETKAATQTKLVFNFGFQHHDQYDLEYTYQNSAAAMQRPAAVQTPGSVSLHLPASDEWTAKLQWSTLFLATSIAGGNPRLDISAEFLKVRNDPARQDRTVARVSYTVPLQGGGSLPFTLTYANRGEFLGQQNKLLSAHLGLSWKIDAPNTKGSGS
jgi:hypothetical protein